MIDFSKMSLEELREREK